VVVEVVIAVALASLAAFRSYCRTLPQKQPERHTWDIDTTAASQPHIQTKAIKLTSF
jgi:hypothetical protein